MVGSIGWWSKSFTNGKWLLNHDVRPLKKLLGFGLFSLRSYCWWLKSCTTWDVWNPIKNGKRHGTTTYQLVPDISHQQYLSDWSPFEPNQLRVTSLHPRCPFFNNRWTVLLQMSRTDLFLKFVLQRSLVKEFAEHLSSLFFISLSSYVLLWHVFLLFARIGFIFFLQGLRIKLRRMTWICLIRELANLKEGTDGTSQLAHCMRKELYNSLVKYLMTTVLRLFFDCTKKKCSLITNLFFQLRYFNFGSYCMVMSTWWRW